jgi:hypothetical protein
MTGVVSIDADAQVDFVLTRVSLKCLDKRQKTVSRLLF